jgi:murein DD-endopeptidase MepM/ murein hydrolase activator NlpD
LSKGLKTVQYRIQKRDTLFDILRRMGTPLINITDLVQAAKKLYPMSSLKPGSEIKIQIDQRDSSIRRFECPIDQDTVLVVNNSPQGLTACKQEIEFETRLSVVAGRIRTSFFEDATLSGLNSQQVLDLADIFGWDIDFLVDVRAGDTFRVLLEDKYKNDRFVYTKKILAAEFRNQGRAFQVFYFKGDDGTDGYYDPQGRSVRKAFLKSPLRYSRISSTFSCQRLHPILKIYRPHYGIDYAAPQGTAVEAVCDGKVSFAGWQKGFGNCIIIQHNTSYVSHYGHLSNFAQSLKCGSKVRQGEVIGYVGSTGLATGPHLDYRIEENGKFINPLSLKNINARGIESGCESRFEMLRKEMLARLEGPEKRGILLAKNAVLP